MELRGSVRPALTITSREIAELVEKRHGNVKRTIETLAEGGVITLPQIEEVLNDVFGPKLISAYHVERRATYDTVVQLSPELTVRVIDRWQEVEGLPVNVRC